MNEQIGAEARAALEGEAEDINRRGEEAQGGATCGSTQETMAQEEWRPVVGYEGVYEVSSLGNVRSLSRINMAGGKVNGRPIKLQSDKNGYYGVLLSLNGIVSAMRVARLVARAFNGPPAMEGLQINHLNGIKTDNRPQNLVWASASENTRHAWKMGFAKKRLGADSHKARLTKHQADHIRARYNAGASSKSLAFEFKVCQSTIVAIGKGRRYL